MNRRIITLLVFTFIASTTIAQDVDLFKMMDDESKKADKKRTDYTTATFKTTRLINGHSIENVGRGILDVKISHRFGPVNGGSYQLWGLDNATMRMGLDYGITDRLMIGVGRSTFEKQYDGFFKYKLLRQSTGYKSFPVSVGLMSSIMLKTLKPSLAVGQKDSTNFSDKLFYATQLIIARKFSKNTSLQLMPTIVHHNIVAKANDPNDVFALGIGGRQKVSKRISINAEYYYVFPDYKLPDTHNSLALGVDIETGGHVFQLQFTNSAGMTERTFISETRDSWSDAGVRFGFNISRVFSIGNKSKKKGDAEKLSVK